MNAKRKETPKIRAVYIPLELHAQLKILAAIEHVTIQDLVEEAVAERLAKKKTVQKMSHLNTIPVLA